jgi:hypothetical protein
MKIDRVGAEFLRADAKTDMTKLIVAINSSLKAPQIDVSPPVYYVDAIMPRSDQYVVLIFICEHSCYAWEGIVNVCVPVIAEVLIRYVRVYVADPAAIWLP